MFNSDTNYQYSGKLRFADGGIFNVNSLTFSRSGGVAKLWANKEAPGSFHANIDLISTAHQGTLFSQIFYPFHANRRWGARVCILMRDSVFLTGPNSMAHALIIGQWLDYDPKTARKFGDMQPVTTLFFGHLIGEPAPELSISPMMEDKIFDDFRCAAIAGNP